jgi:hypothetical protein
MTQEVLAMYGVRGRAGDRGDAGAEPSVHRYPPGVRSAAASPLVWGATPPWRVAQAWVNSAPKNTIRAEY